jgi:hypothetical protein
MSDRPKSIPPFQTSEWEEFAAFRGTFLRLFKPEDADALARIGRLLYDCALECGREWHRERESETVGEMIAAAADFRFLEGLLTAAGREYLEASLGARDTALSQLAATIAPEVAGLAERIEQALGA